MRIYISGAISGTTDYKERFAAAEERLKAAGYEVINPVRVSDALPSLEYGEYMAMCVTELMLCDAIYMLNGWRDSRGAKLEHKIMLNDGRKVLYEDGNDTGVLTNG